MQATLPCLLYASTSPTLDLSNVSTLDLKGGTDAAMAPSLGYLQHVLLPTLRRLFGLTVDLQVQLTAPFSQKCAQQMAGNLSAGIPRCTAGLA